MKINEIKWGAILSYVVIGLNMIVGITYLPFVTGMLGQSEYGLYSLVSSIISYLTVLDLGFSSAIIIYTAKYIAQKDKEKQKTLHGMFFIIYTFIGAIAGVIGIILLLNIDNIFGNSLSIAELEKAKILMSILTLNLIITFPLSIFNSIISAYEKFVFIKIINIVRIILTPLIMIPLLFLGYKSIALVIVLTIVNVICLLINMLYCYKKLDVKFTFKKFDNSLFKEIIIFSFFIFLNLIIDRINWSVDQFIIGISLGTVSVAIYAVASQFNQFYLMFSTAISGVLLPKISKMEEDKATDKEYTDIFIQTGRIQYIIMALIMTGFILFGSPFIIKLFGFEYRESFILSCILLLSVTIPLIQNVGISILQVKNLHKFRSLVFLGIAVLNIILSVVLVNIYGVIGAAIGTAVALILGQGIILNIYYYKKININIPEFWKQILEMTIPVLMSLLIGVIIVNLIPLTKWSFIPQIILYIIVYFLLMWNLGMNDYERSGCKNLLARRK